MDAFLRNWEMAVLASRRRSIILMAVFGALLAACAAAPNRLNVGAAASDSDLLAFPYQTGALEQNLSLLQAWQPSTIQISVGEGNGRWHAGQRYVSGRVFSIRF